MSYSFLDTLYIAALGLLYISSRRCAVLKKNGFLTVVCLPIVTGMLDKWENIILLLTS